MKETNSLQHVDEYQKITIINPTVELPENKDSLQSQEDEIFEPELYTEEELEAVENHIIHYFGDYSYVFHELVSPDIHLDICIIPPTKQKNYYTLVTMGMGAHKMAVPSQIANQKLDRAELLITLPPYWKLEDNDEKWGWPIRLLKILARIPTEYDTWLGWGHTVDNQQPYAENTPFCCAFLISPENVEEEALSCPLPNHDEVNFYQILPLYQEEMDFKQYHNAEMLLDERLLNVDHVVDINRPNTCLNEKYEDEMEIADQYMDAAIYHLENLKKKRLPVDELAAYNHLAIYLRWCIEHDLMSDLFVERFSSLMRDVKRKEKKIDLRETLRDNEMLNGSLLYSYFNEEGAAFAKYYYGDDDIHYYPADVDAYAMQYFGEEKYNSDEFQDEAYLFVPYDESYYEGMKVYLDREYQKWRNTINMENK